MADIGPRLVSVAGSVGLEILESGEDPYSGRGDRITTAVSRERRAAKASRSPLS